MFVRYFAPLALVLAFAGCLQGPAGSDGMNGEDGASLRIETKSGVLDSLLLDSDHWDIAWSKVTDSSLVQVRLRQFPTGAWTNWTFFSITNGSVRIMNSSNINWEYRIILGDPKTAP